MALSGKVTRVPDEDLARAKELVEARLLFLVGAYALITPRGRRLLAEESGESHDDKLPHNGYWVRRPNPTSRGSVDLTCTKRTPIPPRPLHTVWAARQTPVKVSWNSKPSGIHPFQPALSFAPP